MDIHKYLLAHTAVQVRPLKASIPQSGMSLVYSMVICQWLQVFAVVHPFLYMHKA
jgi:hypothetical protein